MGPEPARSMGLAGPMEGGGWDATDLVTRDATGNTAMCLCWEYNQIMAGLPALLGFQTDL